MRNRDKQKLEDESKHYQNEEIKDENDNNDDVKVSLIDGETKEQEFDLTTQFH